MEQLQYNLLYRWFVGLGVDAAVWDVTVFTKNRERLLVGEVAEGFFAAVLAQAKGAGLLSPEHFTVDGTLVQAWAGQKSFRRDPRKPGGGDDDPRRPAVPKHRRKYLPVGDPRRTPPSDGPGEATRNPTVNFHGERRSNTIHTSTTDPDARLARKGSGREAQLAYQATLLTENRHGLAVGVCVTPATGLAERDNAVVLAAGAPYRHAREGHLLTIAPTGAGKGVSAVIPTLLTYAGSVLVTDPKGENVAVTARARRQLGHRVHVLDPFGVAGGADAFNPLDALDASAIDAFDEATLLADMLVVPDGHSSEDAAHWTEEARALLTGLILYVGAHEHGAARTLSRVRQLLTADRSGFAATLRAMQESLLAHGLIAESANQLLQKAEKEQSGVISTAQRHTHFLSSPRMAAVLSQSSLSFASLKHEPATIYLVLPPQHLDTYRRWLRLMVGCALDAMVRTPGAPVDRVLFLFDEFPNLGRMQPIVRHMTLLRGYGANMWLLTQDLSQLRSRYPGDWETLVAAADVIQAFGINDLYTAEYLSRLSGETTVRVTSDQASHGTSRESGALRVSVQERSSFGTAHRGRPLLFPDEIRRLDSSRELLFLKSRDPFITDRANYLTDPELRGLADANPMHAVPSAVSGSHATLHAGRDSTGSELTV